MVMELALIGLGKMGALMAKRLLQDGHRVIGYNLTPEPTKQLEQDGLVGAYSLLDAMSHLIAAKKVVWLMVPHGESVKQVLFQAGGLYDLLSEGDIVIDGGNSYYKETLANAKRLQDKGIHFIDVGTSGGLAGALNGACLMIGGPLDIVHHLEPIFKTLAMPDGYKHVGETGSGHYVKMVHNGIEYGLLQAYGEGFDLLHKAPFDLDMAEVANIWNHGSVIRSWLLELAEQALRNDPSLEHIGDEIGGGSTGEWTTQTAVELNVPVPVLYMALAMRYRSRGESFSSKMVAALRNQFGGHDVKPK
jgi:6-phosphogluconate dehydrogenase